jgi:hypothetical protein
MKKINSIILIELIFFAGFIFKVAPARAISRDQTVSTLFDSSVYAYSDCFTIDIGSGTIRITNPTSSSSWEIGIWYNIEWRTTGNITAVNIEWYKGNTFKDDLTNYANDGNQDYLLWYIGDDFEPGTDWRIKVSNYDNTSQYDWSEYFEIRSPATPPIPGYNNLVIISLLITFTAVVFKRIKK